MTTMVKPRRTFFAFCVLLFAFHFAAPAAEQQLQLTAEEQATFLRTAKIVSERPAGKGTTGALRLTLSDGVLTHDAGFQSIDVRRDVQRLRGKPPEVNFADSYKFNIAAYRLADLLGMRDMIPVTVERAWNGKSGSLSWWVDDVLMDEEERRKTNTMPPDEAEFHRQQQRQRVFHLLVHDTDRNLGNYLYTKDWRLVMIDFSRAFRGWRELPEHPNILRRCDRAVFAALKGLTKQQVQQAVGPYLLSYEIDALLARRDIILKHFDGLIAVMGEAAVLY